MPAAIPKGLPRVLGYDDYRRFLRDHYAARKCADPSYSYGVFARAAGLSSRSHYRNVANGRLNLSPEFVRRFARGLRLSRKEGEFFALLVAVNQAATPEEAEIRKEALRRWTWRIDSERLAGPQAEALFMRWPRLLVYCLSARRGFRADPRWISRKLQGRVTPTEAGEALDYLRSRHYIRTTGRRLLRSSMGVELVVVGEKDDPSSLRWTRPLHRAAADPRRRDFGGAYAVYAVMTPAEAAEVARRVRKAVTEALPMRRRRKVKGELHVLTGDLFALSG